MLAEQIHVERPQRWCAMTRERAQKAELLRLVLDQDGKPFVDLLARAPGRGTYVSPASLRDALQPKGLDRVFKGKAKKLSLEEIEAVVADTTERLEARIVELIGLARRAGVLELGMDSVLRSLEGNHASIVVVTSDASDRTVDRVESSRGAATLVRVSTKEELGRLLGRDEVGVVAVHPSKLADRISVESTRLSELTSSRAES